ncbi:expressed protein [Echinococcus multilocularis]|uniref:Expressed protein n=1 Tax=Echinococcus multilocularis TaxID=6211 RepID=A0A087VWN0_ECHMU|nr:expressed protein [Echinococcus multilocularis]
MLLQQPPQSAALLTLSSPMPCSMYFAPTSHIAAEKEKSELHLQLHMHQWKLHAQQLQQLQQQQQQRRQHNLRAMMRESTSCTGVEREGGSCVHNKYELMGASIRLRSFRVVCCLGESGGEEKAMQIRAGKCKAGGEGMNCERRLVWCSVVKDGKV